MRTLKPSIALCGMFAACTVNVAAAESPAVDLGWLSGHWCLEQGGESVEEHWLPPRGDLLLGIGRTLRAGKVTGFEFLRIELIAGVPNYVAQPGGAPPTAFRLTASGEGWARFENRQHDFPQRIEYRRTQQGLHAEIAGPGKQGGEKVIPFEYRPCGER